MSTRRLTGPQKAAVLLSLIDEESASALLARLDEAEVRAVIAEIARLDRVDPQHHEAIVVEFEEMLRGKRGIETAGPAKVKRLLGRTEAEFARPLLDAIDPAREVEGAEPRGPAPQLPTTLREAPARQLAALLRDEPAQTAALVLAHLAPQKSARVLATMPGARRVEVTRRMAALAEVRPGVLARVGEVLVARLREIDDDPPTPVDGLERAVNALESLGRASGQEVITALEEEQPDLARELRSRLFRFDMLHALADRDVPEVLKQIDRGTLALALKGADPKLAEKFFNNMSERAGAMLREEMDFFVAPRVAEIEHAQRVIIDLVLRLEKEGGIALDENELAVGMRVAR